MSHRVTSWQQHMTMTWCMHFISLGRCGSLWKRWNVCERILFGPLLGFSTFLSVTKKEIKYFLGKCFLHLLSRSVTQWIQTGVWLFLYCVILTSKTCCQCTFFLMYYFQLNLCHFHLLVQCHEPTTLNSIISSTTEIKDPQHESRLNQNTHRGGWGDWKAAWHDSKANEMQAFSKKQHC